LFHRSGIQILCFERFVLDKMFFAENSKNKSNCLRQFALCAGEGPTTKWSLIGATHGVACLVKLKTENYWAN
jgi:hypothetical protein